jgi:hydroxymethylbilane synthase
MRDVLRIATRASKLALWQARFVRDSLAALDPDCAVELVEVTSTGDTVRDRPMYEVGTVGMFTKEVQQAALDGRADVAVHSLKDLPTEGHPDLILAAVPERGPVADVLISARRLTFDRLPEGAVVATSSLRRRAQLLRRRADLRIVDIRGNVETRIRKLREESLDGLILAEAGVRRLGLEAEISEALSEEVLLPAVGQGALAVECRRDDEDARRRLDPLNHIATRQAVAAERAFLHALRGGCQTPVGALARVVEETLTLHGIALDPDGRRLFEGSLSGPAEQAERLGAALAERLLAEGAAELIRRQG